ncbi:MAG: hypothetical protein AB8G05_13435 [Oligoflexales bacterium]
MKMSLLTIILAGLVISGVFLKGSLVEKCEQIEEIKENSEEVIDEIQAQSELEINVPNLVM